MRRALLPLVLSACSSSYGALDPAPPAPDAAGAQDDGAAPSSDGGADAPIEAGCTRSEGPNTGAVAASGGGGWENPTAALWGDRGGAAQPGYRRGPGAPSRRRLP